MPNSSQPQVLIVGAGPTGLMLAIELTLLSLSVRIIDRATATKRQARAGVLWARSQEALAELGVIDKFLDFAHRLQSTHIYINGRKIGGLEYGSTKTDYPNPLCIEQHDTERLLAESLANLGVEVEWEKEAIGLHAHDDGAEITLRNAQGEEETIATQWVVACEGTRSAIREAAQIPFEGERVTNLQTLQVNAKPTWRFPKSTSHGYFFLKENVSMLGFSMPGDSYRFCAFASDPTPDVKTPPSLAEMRDLVAAVTYMPELQLELTAPIWLSRARFQNRIAATFNKGRVLLVGDTAHAWAPIGGHGMNTGLRGAYNLGWKLAAVERGEAKSCLLDTYTIEQRANAQTIIEANNSNVMEQPQPYHKLRLMETFMPIGLSLQPVRRKIEFMLSDLGMEYRNSPLAWQQNASGSLHAGDRIPNVPVVSGNGQWENLHRLTSIHHWTLLLRTKDSEIVERAYESAGRFRSKIKVATIQPMDRDSDRQLGRDGQMFLVRPDGHVGFIGSVNDYSPLVKYLDTFLVRL
ncbi:FAD-dependent monooxygenase [Chamaesiphon minutus]|uniref:2-polyprenyl-6-methoxyphenol hydroxylase-like oxidoreductase n=1 Tax=Chamaesiphon minutus (strain ATCC 27169 / PCC 6605) TaxID=1173020 RepID=K9UEK8_CHAP6|nr:FAD-dependent monooxygenase [Chamaesiphon minutus]AFY92639.1 2-polyprenyl-6-methoxyphenol hydroxylase-like oxidoreductase [Chamaesiphon minutus PCC 6605]